MQPIQPIGAPVLGATMADADRPRLPSDRAQKHIRVQEPQDVASKHLFPCEAARRLPPK